MMSSKSARGDRRPGGTANSTPITRPSRCHSTRHACRDEFRRRSTRRRSRRRSRAARPTPAVPTPKRRATRSKSNPASSNGAMSRANRPDPHVVRRRWRRHAAHHGHSITDIGLQLRVDRRVRVPRLHRDRQAPGGVGDLLRRRQRTRRPVRRHVRTSRQRRVGGDVLRQLGTRLVDVELAPGRSPDERPTHPTAPITTIAAVIETAPRHRVRRPPRPSSDAQRRPGLGTGDADRIDAVTHLEVDHRGLRQRPEAAVDRQDVAEVDEGNLQGGDSRALLIGTNRSRGRATGRRRRTARGRPRWRSPPSSPGGRGSRCTMMSKDPSYTHPSGSTWNTSSASQFSIADTPGDRHPLANLESLTVVVVVDDVVVVGGGHSTVVPNAHPSAHTGSSSSVTPVSAASASTRTRRRRLGDDRQRVSITVGTDGAQQ